MRVVCVFRPLTPADAAAIVGWRYDEPLAFYNWEESDDPAELLDPSSGSLVADDHEGRLAGFICFGPLARVPGGEAAGLYADALLDVGLGLRPDLTGRGLGLGFVLAALAAGEARYAPAGYRLSVAAFNTRAIRVYERAGFVIGEQFASPVHGVETPFVLMRRRRFEEEQ